MTEPRDIEQAVQDAFEKRGRGRPSVWEDPEVERVLIEAIQCGLSWRRACDAAGIGYQTFKDRLNADDADDDFPVRVARARGDGCLHHARVLRNVSDPEKVKPQNAGPAAQAARQFLATHDRDAWTERKEVAHANLGSTIAELLAEEAANADDEEAADEAS